MLYKSYTCHRQCDRQGFLSPAFHSLCRKWCPRVPNYFEQHLECVSVRYAKYPREDLCWNVQNAVY